MTEKTIFVKKKRWINGPNGEKIEKEYLSAKTYTCKGYLSADGERKQKVVLTPEQITDAKHKLNNGVKKNFICNELNCTNACLNKALNGWKIGDNV